MSFFYLSQEDYKTQKFESLDKLEEVLEANNRLKNEIVLLKQKVVTLETVYMKLESKINNF